MLAIIDTMFVNEKLFRIYSHFVQDKYILEGEMRPNVDIYPLEINLNS